MIINNDQDYEQALARLEIIFDAKLGSTEGEELENLTSLIEEYENKCFPITPPDSE